MNILYVLCGPPGIGKTTFVSTFLKNDFLHVSRDEIRFELISDEDDYFSKEDEVYKIFIQKIKDGLKEKNVIADATHITAASRVKLLRALGNTLKNVIVHAIVFKTSLDKCIERNNLREGRSKVPISVIRRMYHQYTMPSFDEGFDKITVYMPDEGYYKFKEVMEIKE